MVATARPVDRWFSFGDRWPASVVDTLLDQLKSSGEDMIYDPFVGCGTTAVTAAARGFATVSCDANPIAALVARYKLKPPSQRQLRAAVSSIDQTGIQTTFRMFAEPSLGSLPDHDEADLIRFLIAVSLLRTGWHLGVPWNDDQVSSEFLALLAEMAEDTDRHTNESGIHRVECSDFRCFDPRLQRKGGGQIIMITSPPFFASDRNPLIQRLSELLGLPWPSTLEAIPGETGPTEAACVLGANSAAGSRAGTLALHYRFLAQIVAHAAETGCSRVALEMSGSFVGGRWEPFDDFLADRLRELGYSVHLESPIDGQQESERLIVGWSG